MVGGAQQSRKSLDGLIVARGFLPFERNQRKQMFHGFSTNRRGMSRWALGNYFELVGRMAFLSLFLVPSPPKFCGSAACSLGLDARPLVAAVASSHRETPPRLASASPNSATSSAADLRMSIPTPTPIALAPLTATTPTAAAAAAMVSATVAPEATEPSVGGGAAYTVSDGSAPPTSPPTAVDATASAAGAAADERTTLTEKVASVMVLATAADAEGSEQGRVKIEPVAAKPGDGNVKEEGTPPIDDGGAGPRDDGGGVEAAKATGTGSTGGSSNPEGAMGCSGSVRSSPPSLSEWLKEGPFVLAMSPGFFGFYAHIGALVALEAAGLLEKVSFAVGASAGGLVAGLFASGMSPEVMGKTVVKFRRADFWDPVGFGGLLQGRKFEGIVEKTLPEGVQRFDQCRVPLAVSAFDVSRLTTRVVKQGSIAPALRATCTFPGLFAPVWHEQGVLVDGGIRDTTGMWCVPEERENCRRVLNVTFGCRDGRGVCVPPSRFPTESNPRPVKGMEIASLALTGLPRPHPFAMERGAEALEAARSQVAAVLSMPLLAGHEARHWIAPTTPPQSSDVPVANGVGAACGNGKLKAKNSAAAYPAGATTVALKVEASGGAGEENAVLNKNSRPQEHRMEPPLDLSKAKKRRRADSWSCHDGELPPSSTAVSKNSDSMSVANHQGFACAAGSGGATLGSAARGEMRGGGGGSSQEGRGQTAQEVVGTTYAQGMGGGGGPGVGVTSAAREESGVSTAVEMPTPRRSKRMRKPKIPYTGS